jgi:hypothetical protein
MMMTAWAKANKKTKVGPCGMVDDTSFVFSLC